MPTQGRTIPHLLVRSRRIAAATGVSFEAIPGVPFISRSIGRTDDKCVDRFLMMSKKAKIYISLIIAMGSACLASGMIPWQSQNIVFFLVYGLLAALSSTFKVKLPSVTGSISVNFLFVLMGVSTLSLSEVLAIGVVGTLVQAFWKPKSRPKAVQVVFSVASMVVAISSAYNIFHSDWVQIFGEVPGAVMAITTIAFFTTNTIQVATVISLVEKKRIWKTWQDCYFWSFPYYLMGAAIVLLLDASSKSYGWKTSLLM